jgi:hypothetical protein
MTTKGEPQLRTFYGVPPDGGEDLAGNFEKFVAHLQRRKTRAEPVTVIIDGRETGVGKSSLAIELARRLDPGFGTDSFVYKAAELYALYESKPDGAAALYDESVLGLLSRRGARDDELAGLIGALSIVRKNGISTFLCVPKITMLDSIVYNGLAPHWIFIEAKGRGRVHRAHKGAHYRKSQPRLPYDLWRAVSPLTWRNLDGDPFFEAYKERAKEHNRAYFREQQEISELKRRRLLGLKPDREEGESLENVPTRPMVPRSAPAQTWNCAVCGEPWPTRWQRQRHEVRCRARLHLKEAGPIAAPPPVA